VVLAAIQVVEDRVDAGARSASSVKAWKGSPAVAIHGTSTSERPRKRALTIALPTAAAAPPYGEITVFR